MTISDAAPGSADDPLRRLIAANNQAVLTTIKRDGRPQLSVINYGVAGDLLRVSITADRAKYHNLKRDPRASLMVLGPGGRGYAVVESTADFSAVAAAPDDEAVAELIELYRSINGEHPDWDDYRRAMVADQRVVLRLPIERTYGWA